MAAVKCDSDQTKTCWGCQELTYRIKRQNKAQGWCTRYHRPAEPRCLDYRTKRTAIRIALDYLRRTSIK